MSGGGGEQKSQQQTQSSSGPPAYIQPYLQAGIQDLQSLYNANPTAPGYFPGSTVAPQSGYTTQAIDSLAARGAGGSPVTAGAQGAITDTLNGKYLDPTSNPQYLQALQASHQPYVDQFMSEVIPGITSAFEGSGRTGGGLHQGSVDRAVTGLNRTISDADAKAGSAYFGGERDRMIGAAGIAPQIAATDYQDIAALGQAGEAKDAYGQAKTNEDISRYNYDNNKQWDYISRYLGMLNGGYPGGETSSFGTQTQQRPSTSPFGTIMSGLGTGLQIASMFGYSDARLKENIVPVGETYDGQNLYLYNYKGDATPQVGLMAQEVEKVRPEAVVEDSSGFKMVNYGKALGLF